MTLDRISCYRALTARDARFDGVFYVGVTSTRIYCRPVCRVKMPRAANCRYFSHPAAAERAGFRPCLRCRPELAPGTSLVDATAQLAERATRAIAAGALNGASLEALAHFHLSNGARIERVCWAADTSDKGVKESAALMVNYLYDPARIEQNHEDYAGEGKRNASTAIRKALKV